MTKDRGSKTSCWQLEFHRLLGYTSLVTLVKAISSQWTRSLVAAAYLSTLKHFEIPTKGGIFSWPTYTLVPLECFTIFIFWILTVSSWNTAQKNMLSPHDIRYNILYFCSFPHGGVLPYMSYIGYVLKHRVWRLRFWVLK